VRSDRRKPAILSEAKDPPKRTTHLLPYGMLFYVAIGGALGGVSRYLLGGLVQRMLDTTFPAGTLFVNISGSFLLGAILRYALDTPSLTPEVRAFLTIGFCGGYTTFSTFSYETVALLKDGEWTRAGFYVAASVLLSVLGTFLGFALARQVIAFRVQL
jgi:CrcB protein